MSIPSETKNLNAKCADTRFFFIWGANKNVNAEKKGALYIKERFIYILPCIHYGCFVCIPI